MAGFDRIPGIDEDNKFPPVVMTALKEELLEVSADTSGVYGRDADENVLIPFSDSAEANAIVRRDAAGTFDVPEPTDPTHPTPKSYVDDLVIPNFLILGPLDSIPGGTPADTVILRTAS